MENKFVIDIKCGDNFLTNRLSLTLIQPIHYNI